MYLGDGVYVKVDRGDVILETSDGVTITNRIVMEPEVLKAFLRFIELSKA